MPEQPDLSKDERESPKKSTIFLHLSAVKGRTWGLLGVGLVVVLLVGGAVLQRTPAQEAPPAAGAGELSRAYGPEDAPVTIVEYADFGCPNCQRWSQSGVMEQVLLEYSDKVRFVWRDFPVITAESPKAAEAGWCANDQGQFWKYHNLLYLKTPALSVNDLKEYADYIGLDMQEFNQCLDAGQHAADVEQDLRDALSHGFQGAPSFMVNDRLLAGPPSFEQLQSLIDALLVKQSAG